MASLGRPVALEACQTSLCELRHSSFNLVNSVPHAFCSSPCDGTALADDDGQSEGLPPSPTKAIPPLSPLTQAQLPDHAPRTIICRHGDKVPAINTESYGLPSLSYNTRYGTTESPEKSNLPVVDEDDCTMEKVRWRLASGFFAYFVLGWGDGVTGTVLPYLMKTFDINFTLSSLLYVGSTIGFVFGTAAVESVIHYLGRFNISNKRWSWIPKTSLSSKSSAPQTFVGYSPSQARLLSIVTSSVTHAMFFVLMGSRNGYWACFSAYAVAAFSRGILTASLNEYFASGYRQSLGYAFGTWSFGGIVAPFVCQTAISRGIPWHKFYLGSLILSGLNTAFLTITFRPTAREFLRDRRVALSAAALRDKYSSAPDTPIDTPIDEVQIQLPEIRNTSTLSLALSLPYQWYLCLFGFIYSGCEITTQGFMVSYLLVERNAPKSAGYVTSGFWAGITIGRLLWGHYTPKLSYVQRKWVIEGCIGIAIQHDNVDILIQYLSFAVTGFVMHILIWTVKSAIQNALATSIIGLVYGPVYPALLTLANDILPAKALMVSMALISATASLGSAVFPFLTGVLSTSKGIHILTYMTSALGCTVSFLWAMFPSRIPRRSRPAPYDI